MTFYVNYTERSQPDSSAIDRAWYNSGTKELFLELHGVVYRYDDVNPWQYESLVGAASPGSYYRNYIRGYHHGTRLGAVSGLQEVNVKSKVGVFSPADMTGAGAGAMLYPGVIEAKSLQAHPVQKPHLPLNKDVTKTSDGKYAHTMEFVIDDGSSESEEKTHVVYADSMDNAIDEMFELANLLNQTITLKGVHVRFE